MKLGWLSSSGQWAGPSVLFGSPFAGVLLTPLLFQAANKATQDTESRSQPPAQMSFVTSFFNFKILIKVPSRSLFLPTKSALEGLYRTQLLGSSGVRPGCHISVTRTWGPPCAVTGEGTVTLSTSGSLRQLHQN